jgi:DNA-binding MarR family transcriptional regulator
VTGLVDALVSDGLVTRDPHPTDRRAALVTFTPRGETLVARLRRDHRALAPALFGPMSRRELDGFAHGLAGVIERLRARVAVTSGRP